MGLNLIGEGAKKLTNGEKAILNKLKELYKSVEYEVYVYVQMKIGVLVPDYIIIDQMRGMSILEVKDWDYSYIQASNKRKVKLIDREEDNPVFKTKKYLDLLNGIIANRGENLDFISEYIYANTMMVYLSQKDVMEDETLKDSLNFPNVRCYYKEHIKDLQIQDLFGKETLNMASQQIQELRILLFPEIKIVHKTRFLPNQQNGDNKEEAIKTFDAEQEKFAKRIPYGHYMVTGIPGSGKTVILIARAIHIIRENPNWHICILSYNKALQAKIEQKINLIASEMIKDPFQKDIPIQNIEVKTFHALAREVSNVNVPIGATDKWWREELPQIAYEKATPRYDAILIDEYQDFYENWIRVCLKLCKLYWYNNTKGEQIKGINLFMAGDRLQSIYNEDIVSWKALGIDMRGRSKLLKMSYRTGNNHIELALKFLQENEALSKEVKDFYKDDGDEYTKLQGMKEQGNIQFVEGIDRAVVKTIKNIVESGTYTAEDILIVSKVKKRLDELKKMMGEGMGEIEYVTYLSSKGLENKVVILLDMDQFIPLQDNKKNIIDYKTVYVGMTRASELLIIHANNGSKKSHYKTIKELWES